MRIVPVPLLLLAFVDSPARGAPLPADLPARQVARQLREYGKEADPARRAARLAILARSRDPRVAILLGESLKDRHLPVRVSAADGLTHYYLPSIVPGGTEAQLFAAERWWLDNEALLRDQARWRKP